MKSETRKLLDEEARDYDNMIHAVKELLIGHPRRLEIENILEVKKTCAKIRFRNIK